MTPLIRQRIVLINLIVITTFLLFIVAMEYVVPLLADLYYQDEYRELSAKCDEAMHDEASLRPGTIGAEKHPALTLSAEVELMVCHDYDKLRKRLLSLGVSEHTLALRSLEALENEQIPVSRLIEPHRMERF